MKTMKKLQVAVAAASLFAVTGGAMAASISQSGITVAREAISANVAADQKLRAPTVSYSFDNGPTANANSTQDFNVTLVLGGDGAAEWGTQQATYKTVAAYRRNNGNAVVPVLPLAEVGNVGAGKAALVLMAVDVHAALDAGVDVASSNKQKYRYKFRLVNNTAAPIAIGDLQLAFNGANPGDGAGAPWNTGNATVDGVANVPAAVDYAEVTKLAQSVNATPVLTGSSAGETGNTDSTCGEGIRKITVLARNYIGSGDGVQGESQGANIQSILNGGYIQFQTAVKVVLSKDIALDRNTDPLAGNQKLVIPAGNVTTNDTMVVGSVSFANRNIDAFDIDLTLPYYKLALNDLDDVDNETNGDVDVGSLSLNLTSTNGFAAGTTFGLSNSPLCLNAETVYGATTLTPVTFKDATVSFTVAQLANANAFGAATSLTNVDGNLAAGAPYNLLAGANTTRAFVCMKVPGTGLIPQSRFSGTATLVKEHANGGIGLEQANKSCPADLAGLGGGIKIDVRNYMEFPAGSEWESYVRVINNSETVTADVFAQYIRADGTYGKWVKLFDLPARAARFISGTEINAAMAATGANSSAGGADQGYNNGVAATYAGSNARLRISSEAASTLRVQNYIYNSTTKLLSEMSGAQGADFVNIESSTRDHIDQDAQTGIKK